jgi:hypothetical protein
MSFFITTGVIRLTVYISDIGTGAFISANVQVVLN